MYLIKLALRPWRLSPWAQVFSALSTGVLLVLAGLLVWIHMALSPIVERLTHEQVITAYLDPSVTEKEQGRVVDSIRLIVGSAGASALRLVDQDEFIKDLRSTHPELAHEIETLGTESASVVPRYVTTTGMLPAQVVDEIRSVPGIESAETSKDRNRGMLGAFLALRWVALFLASGIAAAMLIGVFHLTRLCSYHQKDAVALLRLMGASLWVLRAPSAIYGLLIGLAGGAVGYFGWVIISFSVLSRLQEFSPALGELSAPSQALGLLLVVGGGALGALAGLLGGKEI